MGKRGPRSRPPVRLATTDDLLDLQTAAPERPPIPWDRIILEEPDAARLLKYGRSTFRAKAAAGEFPRYGEPGSYRYYAYDLIDYMLARRAER